MPVLTIALAEVPAEDAGLASGIVNVSMQLSAALGLAVLGSLSTDRTAALVAKGLSLSSSLTAGYQFAFAIAAGCVGVGLVVAQFILRSTDASVRIQPAAAVEECEELRLGAPAWESRDAA